MDLFEKCYNYTIADDTKKMGLYPYFHEITSKQHSEVVMEGRRTIMLGSNNYLGLTSDQRVIEAAREALSKYGTGCSGSRFLNGTLSIHHELESNLAEFFHKDAAITYSTGFQTNLGIVSSLVGRHDNIYADRQNHASLVDAAKLSYGKLSKFDHNNMEQLEEQIAKRSENRGALIAVDGIFSMEGDVCNLPEIVRIAKKYGARILVDDSHSAGVMGKTGRGTGEYFGMSDDIDLIMGTFSKSFASLGGFVVGDQKVIDFARHHSRPFIFSASIPPSNAAAALKSLEILKAEPERLERLAENAKYMKDGFKQLGIPHGEDSVAPIIPVNTYDDIRTFKICKALLENGVYVNPVISPAVDPGESILRTSYMATHTKEQLDYALDKFDLVFNKLFPISEDEIENARNAAVHSEE